MCFRAVWRRSCWWVQTASPLTPTGMSPSRILCDDLQHWQWLLWQFPCLEDAKDVLLTCKGFDYWMLQINVGMLLLKLTHPLATFWWLNHPHTRTQTTGLVAHSCRLSCRPRTTLLTSITWRWSCMKHAWSLASSCLPTWSSFGQFHRWFHRSHRRHNGWIIHLCGKIAWKQCLWCSQESTVCETKPQFTGTPM